MKNLIPDAFTNALMLVVLFASIFPVEGRFATYFDYFTDGAIALLFFLHGAKLSREAVISGISHWRLHLTVMSCTFIIFPLLALLFKPVISLFLSPELVMGMVFLCLLPSTVQSSIAFTSMAKGNVPAAICSASASNLLGIFITPLLVLLVMQSDKLGLSWAAVGDIVLLLLLPFVAGQLSQPYTQRFLSQHPRLISLVDQGSVLLIVYTAFSFSVVQGLWHELDLIELAELLAVCCALLAVILAITCYGARYLGFNKADEITIVFCGSKKTMISGIPMAKIIFSTSSLGAIILPLMLFHQIQLMVCAFIARHYAQRDTRQEV